MTNRKKYSNNHALRTIHIAKRKIKFMYSVISVICLALTIYVVYYQIKSSQEKKIANEYAQVIDVYNQEDLAYQNKIKELEKNKNSSSEEQDLEADYSKSMPKLLEFSLKYPSSPYGWQAAIRASDYYIKNDNLAEAQKALEAVLPYTLTKSWIQIKLRTTLAGIYATQNKVDKAIEQLTIVENYPHNPLQNQSRLLKAQIYISNKNFGEAKKLLNQIISTPSESQSPTNPFDPSSNQDRNDIKHQSIVLLNRIGF